MYPTTFERAILVHTPIDTSGYWTVQVIGFNTGRVSTFVDGIGPDQWIVAYVNPLFDAEWDVQVTNAGGTNLYCEVFVDTALPLTRVVNVPGQELPVDAWAAPRHPARRDRGHCRTTDAPARQACGPDGPRLLAAPGARRCTYRLWGTDVRKDHVIVHRDADHRAWQRRPRTCWSAGALSASGPSATVALPGGLALADRTSHVTGQPADQRRGGSTRALPGPATRSRLADVEAG